MEESVDGLPPRLEGFFILTDMIRRDSLQILEENISLLKAKAMEMARHIC